MSDFNTVKDSGERRVFDTGAQRDRSSGKGFYDCLPPYAIHRIARHFENGAEKYDRDNWRKGIPFRCYLDSALRHTFRYLEGYRDEDHLSAAAWNLLCLIESEEAVRRGIMPLSLNDLPDYVTMPENNKAPRSLVPHRYMPYSDGVGTYGVWDRATQRWALNGESHPVATQVSEAANGRTGGCTSECREVGLAIREKGETTYPADVPAAEKGDHD